MKNETVKKILESGIHFGHKTSMWNPKMNKYIYCKKNGIHIIDLTKTISAIDNTVIPFISKIAKLKKPILFVGTKKQAQDCIKTEALKCESYYINKKWIGGLLTNHKSIYSKITRLNKLKLMEKLDDYGLLTKKEINKLQEEQKKLENIVGGINGMKELPCAIIVIDIKHEETAIKEARKLHIPIIGLVDTNCDPDLVDYVIPGNDDAIRAISLILSILSDTIIMSRKENNTEIKETNNNIENNKTIEDNKIDNEINK